MSDPALAAALRDIHPPPLPATPGDVLVPLGLGLALGLVVVLVVVLVRRRRTRPDRLAARALAALDTTDAARARAEAAAILKRWATTRGADLPVAEALGGAARREDVGLLAGEALYRPVPAEAARAAIGRVRAVLEGRAS